MKVRYIIGLIALVGTVAFLINTINISTGSTSNYKQEKSVAPNYSIVFPGNEVNRIDIKMEKSDWEKMQNDLDANIGASHKTPPMRAGKRKEVENPATASSSESANKHNMHHRPPAGGPRHKTHHDSIPRSKGGKRMGPPARNMGVSTYKPLSVTCTINFNNKEWKNVGIRYKGNSSLRSAYQQGIKKLSFKLNFDQFEDEYPEIKNQRFYGFQQLNLKNNFNDQSFIREKVASDLFSEFGLASPKTSFYQVYVDYGEGPQYFGLYTMVEEVDDTLIETAFSGGEGNLYKPDGVGASFAHGSFRSTDMNKKKNKKEKDFSDVKKLYEHINSSLRTENYELWKTQLTEIFDVPVFLKWLAANTVMQNWDTYGKMHHNYYLYNNPSNGKLVWIPWDNNEALQHGKMGGSSSLSFDEVNDEWPLIRYIIDDKEWSNAYKNNVSEFTTKVFDADKMILNYSNYQELLKDFVIGKQGEKPEYTFLRKQSDFAESIDFLKQHVQERKIAVQDFLDTNNM